MTDAAVAAIVGGIPATLVALGALIQGIRNGKKADTAAQVAVVAAGKADAAVVKADELAVMTSSIEAKANGSLSELKQELAVARMKIEGLEAARQLAAVNVALATPVQEPEKQPPG